MAMLGSATPLYQYGHNPVASGVGLLTSGHVSANDDSRLALTGVSGDPSGYLRPEEVIFYHPCDDRNEWTTGQTWQGPVGSAAAKVGNGFAPVAGDQFSVEPESEFQGTAISLFQGGAPIVHLSPSSVVVAYVADGVLYAKVGTTSGCTLTWGGGQRPRRPVEECVRWLARCREESRTSSSRAGLRDNHRLSGLGGGLHRLWPRCRRAGDCRDGR